ncbi:tRNA pseudouridine(55) synthase TruB [Peribacillus castrilensis]|uniref:tRNA pseudouridine synthase B n=1 Tax=Peribacillus simplex TaxID=1478 RepID=A0AAN2PFX4_9BACI|nr:MULTISPECIES: tRNA pseudouridine(55) synthase TruB [Bacillaceae]MCP1093090.1 tRNA pseudouridine(55) synthase TruB [Bacillaceae bacterium OS4b]MBD8589023.1 tRNA pseudouridine(55) synthase TruB [Peribacillus simplex]MCF7621798.1 tRNA pseudouridine(55) synthase TruB [Peribacillus frigoritolerans]MCP1152456.1 tRNA pseudouridine(55) synthase TruB [Peribacillus frigoritolerans]MCT1387271.1 tRNA pseudouridine(55) synthase TruB [Peribacillus frigoritolerans]
MNGILPLWKPKGLTSHDCVFKLRKILKTKKVGHTGTLDPDVTGVLPICIGRATKIAEYLTEAGKAYEGEVTLGFSTTTEDASGEKVEEKKIDQVIQRKRILEVLESLTGKIEQTPPMFSAVKVNGKKLYEYARAGIDVERPTREVTIYDITLLDDRSEFKGKTISFRFRVNCSKGTYIRTLAVMMGEELGFPAHMSDLTRIESAGFKQEDCFTFSEVEEFMENGQTDEFLLPLERGLFHLPKFQISDKVAKKVLNGAVLEQTKDVVVEKGMPFVMVDPADKAIAIYQIHPTKEGLIKPVKVLAQEL